jgi:small-conductance mechanosensitive channel
MAQALVVPLRAATPEPIDDLAAWLELFTHRSVLAEVAVLAVCVALAWSLVVLVRRGLGRQHERSILFGRNAFEGVLFPLALLCFGYMGRALLAHYSDIIVMRVAIPALVALVVIRVGVKVLQVAFADAPWVRLLEQTISWLAWLGLILWVSGLLPLILNELDQITWKVGASTLSVRNIIEGLVTASVVLLITLWISSAIEARVLQSATGAELSLRKAVSNATRALLMFVGLMLALSAVGIDLTALSVLGGAVGVGIGFGLQRLAASYVSGFVILAERGLRIGDSVLVDGFEGVITQINARYTVIRSLVGRESIVPNEMLITQRVENLSLQDSKVFDSTVVCVAYDSDLALVQRLLIESAAAQGRVLQDPGPSVFLSRFAADGLEFTLGYWIGDPEMGQLNLRSDVNIAILTALRSHNIEIPFPQRVVHAR